MMARKPQDKGTLSVSAAAYARFEVAARSRGVKVARLVEQALAGHLPDTEVPAVPVTVEFYRAAAKVARQRATPIAAVMDAAVLRALADAEAFPERVRRVLRRRTIMVAHARMAARRAS